LPGTILKEITTLLSILHGLLMDFFEKKTEVLAINYTAKVNHSRYRPGVSQRVSGS